MFQPMTQSRPDPAATTAKRKAEVPALADLPDLLLVERARTRDSRAPEALMRRYNRRLFRISRSILGDAAAAEAAVREAHLRAFSNLDRYEPTGKFGAWLSHLAFNEAQMMRKRPQIEAGEQASPTATAVAGSQEASVSVDARPALEQAIDALPEVFRTAYVMRVVEELSGAETAACLGLNETTVRTRLHRARRRLRAEVAQRIQLEHADLFEFDPGRCERIIASVLDKICGPQPARDPG